MTSGLASVHCRIHYERPAAARCPTCMEYFCGECITENSGKLTCASCMAVRSSAPVGETGNRMFFWLAPLLQTLGAVFLIWTLFYLFAGFLGDIPDEFHDGTILE